MPWRGASGVARYGVPGLLLGAALMGGFGSGRGPSAQAQTNAPPGAERTRAASAPAGDSSGTIAFTTSAPGSGQLLYLIDTRSRAFAIYRVDPANPTGKGTVKLEATRQYQWDLKLEEYNNQDPPVHAVMSQIRALGQPNR